MALLAALLAPASSSPLYLKKDQIKTILISAFSSSPYTSALDQLVQSDLSCTLDAIISIRLI